MRDGSYSVTGVALSAILVPTSAGGAMPSASSADARGTRLVVVVVDQFRYDYLRRFGAYFADDGFGRFLDAGATLTRTSFRHATTDSCPGHAVISTGTWGNSNGIIANRWYDSARRTEVDCAGSDRDDLASRLLRPTLGDVLKRATNGAARVIAVTGKRGTAMLMGGQAADGVYWPDRRGRFVTWDGTRPPQWVATFNGPLRARSFLSRVMDKLLPGEANAPADPDHDPARNGGGLGPTFPHPAETTAGTAGNRTSGADQDMVYGSDRVAEFAIAALREERLGADDATDLLAIGFSSTDSIGHRFGPDSREMMDAVVRTDQLIAQLLDALDRRVGLDRTLVVLTADHGTASLPEVAARRPDGGGARRITEDALTQAVNSALDAAFGKPPQARWVAFHDFPNVFLDPAAIRSRGVGQTAAENVARRALESVPGVAAAFTRSQLNEWRMRGNAPEAAVGALLSFHPERSGSVVYQVSRNSVVADRGTNHGSHWNYDTDVPLMWLGPGLKVGHHDMQASPADVLPTLLALLSVDQRVATDGCVLHEIVIRNEVTRDCATAAPPR